MDGFLSQYGKRHVSPKLFSRTNWDKWISFSRMIRSFIWSTVSFWAGEDFQRTSEWLMWERAKLFKGEACHGYTLFGGVNRCPFAFPLCFLFFPFRKKRIYFYFFWQVYPQHAIWGVKRITYERRKNCFPPWMKDAWREKDAWFWDFLTHGTFCRFLECSDELIYQTWNKEMRYEQIKNRKEAGPEEWNPWQAQWWLTFPPQ